LQSTINAPLMQLALCTGNVHFPAPNGGYDFAVKIIELLLVDFPAMFTGGYPQFHWMMRMMMMMFPTEIWGIPHLWTKPFHVVVLKFHRVSGSPCLGW